MNFNYENGEEIAEYIYNEMLDVNFFGLTVSVVTYNIVNLTIIYWIV